MLWEKNTLNVTSYTTQGKRLFLFVCGCVCLFVCLFVQILSSVHRTAKAKCIHIIRNRCFATQVKKILIKMCWSILYTVFMLVRNYVFCNGCLRVFFFFLTRWGYCITETKVAICIMCVCELVCLFFLFFFFFFFSLFCCFEKAVCSRLDVKRL